MKNKLFLYIIAIMAMGCSSETDTFQTNTNITCISVGTIAAGTKTATDETSNVVTWEVGDEIAVFHVGGSGRDDYKEFVLSEGAGSNSAKFTGVTDDDYLIPGQTYKLVYPYSSAVYDCSSNNEFICRIIHTVDYLSTHDWLYSAEKVMPTDGTTPTFTIQHALALIKVTLNVTNFVKLESSAIEMDYIEFITKNGTSPFAHGIYWDTDMKFAVASYYDCSFTVHDSSFWKSMENGTTIFWLPIFQDSSLGIQDLDIKVNMIYKLSDMNYYASRTTTVSYSPSSVLMPGSIYPINLNFRFDGGKYYVGTLSVEE